MHRLTEQGPNRFSAWPATSQSDTFHSVPITFTHMPSAPTNRNACQNWRNETTYFKLFTQNMCGCLDCTLPSFTVTLSNASCLSAATVSLQELGRDRDITRVNDSTCCDLLHLFSFGKSLSLRDMNCTFTVGLRSCWPNQGCKLYFLLLPLILSKFTFHNKSPGSTSIHCVVFMGDKRSKLTKKPLK